MDNYKISVLIVEDDAGLRNSFMELLRYTGFKVHGAPDGLAALEELDVAQPDIVLSDLNMPRMDGYELLTVVRSRYPGIRLVAMSGAYTGEVVPFGVAADAFYPKGCSQCSRLIATLKRVVALQFSPARAEYAESTDALA